MSDLTDAWEAAVQAETAVAYAYAVAGPRVDPAQRSTAAALYDAHEAARDSALLALVAAGGEPGAIPTFFELPGPVAQPAEATALLALVESRLLVVYADLVRALPLEQRQVGLDGVLAASQRALQWGAAPGAWGAAPA